MTNSLSETFDRVASNAIIGLMIAGLPIAGVMFVVNSMAV